jgi:hypothetical protein
MGTVCRSFVFPVSDICGPYLMTSLFNIIFKAFVPVTGSHQPHIVSNVSLKKKTKKNSHRYTPPPYPQSSVLNTQIPWFHAGLTRPRSYKHFVQVDFVTWFHRFLCRAVEKVVRHSATVFQDSKKVLAEVGTDRDETQCWCGK